MDDLHHFLFALNVIGGDKEFAARQLLYHLLKLMLIATQRGKRHPSPAVGWSLILVTDEDQFGENAARFALFLLVTKFSEDLVGPARQASRHSTNIFVGGMCQHLRLIIALLPELGESQFKQG